jgi:hypothetical protein
MERKVYKVLEEKRVKEEDILKSPHYVKFVMDPSAQKQAMYCRLGPQVSLEDLVRSLEMMTFGCYRALFELPDGAAKAELFKKMVRAALNKEEGWKKPLSADN